MLRIVCLLATVTLVLALAACATPVPPPVPTPLPTQTAPTTAPQAAAATSAPTGAAPSGGATAPSSAPTSTNPPAAAKVSIAPEVPAGNTLRIREGAFPDTLDPQQVGFVNEIAVVGLVYEGLVALDSDLKPVGGAAESWTISNDGQVYTFKLRPGLKYSDGQPLTAKNFEYALKRAADPTLGGAYQSSTFDIEGAEEYGTADPKATSAEDLQKLRDKMAVKALDDQTLEIRLVKRAVYFPYIAYLWIGYPVREDSVAKGEDWWLKAENHIGNGPFVLKSLSENDNKAVFVPNPYWRGPKASLDQLVYLYIPESNVAFQAYLNGELDMTGLSAFDLPTVQSDPRLSAQILKTPGSCSGGYGFNLTRPPFDKREVRLAFAKAFDREAWTRDVARGLASPSLAWLVPGIPGYDPNAGAVQKFDPPAAKELLAKAGYPNGQGLPEIKLTYGSTPRAKVVNEFIANQFLMNLGVQVVLDPVEPKLLVGLLKDVRTAPALAPGGWCSDYPDPQDWFTLYWRSTAWAKNIGYKNEELDKLMDAADVEADPAKRIAMYQRAEKIILEQDVVFMPTDNGDSYRLVKPYVVYGKPTSHDQTFPGWFEPWKLGVKR